VKFNDIEPVSRKTTRATFGDCGIRGIKYQEGTLDTTNASNEKSREPLTGKKPYKAPSFRFQTAFEASALSCGKIAGTSSACNSNKKLS
jgi:hypothetical protein